MSFDRLLHRILVTGNPTVVGLDPSPSVIPPSLRKRCSVDADPLDCEARTIWEFNRGIIDSICDVVPAVKPQSAFYEALGWRGFRVLEQTIRYAKEKGMYVILDAKRGDIGSTMHAYIDASLGDPRIFDADALTVNGYFGYDSMEYALDVCRKQDKALFVLVKTSNPSSGDLQDLPCGEGTLYQTVGKLCEKWGEGSYGEFGYSPVGAVVGATWPETLRELRQAMPHTLFLVPGFGAQGGTAKDVAGAFDSRGLGAIVNASRLILKAWESENTPEAFGSAARGAALAMRRNITDAVRSQYPDAFQNA